MRTSTNTNSIQVDKFFLTEIINDLHRNGFEEGGKAQEMLHVFSAELRDKSRKFHPASRLRKEFNNQIGKNNW